MVSKGGEIFAFYHLTEKEMLEAVVVALEGDALRWYQWEHNRRPIRMWNDLKTFMLRQFRPVNGGSLYEQWLSTSQTTTVNEYRRQFIETAAPLEHLSENILLGQFINGLKEEIRAEVRLLNPVNVKQAMEMAIKVEERNRVVVGRRPILSYNRTSPPSGFTKSNAGSVYSAGPTYNPGTSKGWGSVSSESQASVVSPKSNTATVSNKAPSEFRRLTEKELQDKRAQGDMF